MITGLIALIILVAVLPPAISNGQTGVVIAAVIVAVVVLAIGAASREEDRAYSNFMDHWADGGPNRDRRK